MSDEKNTARELMPPPPTRPLFGNGTSRRPILIDLENDSDYDVIDCTENESESSRDTGRKRLVQSTGDNLDISSNNTCRSEDLFSESSTFLGKRKRLAQSPGGNVRNSNTTCRTEDVLHVESIHGKKRRMERRIGILDLKAAVKYGIQRPGRQPNTTCFHYNGIVFIRDDKTGREITSYSDRLFLDYVPISSNERKSYQKAKKKISEDYSSWTSHSVFIVDISGSMRNSDVQGQRTRLGAVWYSLAEDFVKKRIHSGESGRSDAITIVLMGETSKVLMEHEPTDWCLYNKICKIYNQDVVIPRNHGCYIPALEVAEEILKRNNSNSCALSLTILSDGKPSDHYVFNHISHNHTISVIQNKVGVLCSRLGRRLTLATIGMGSSEEFETLKNMSKLAEDYGSVGLFQLPSLSCSKLGDAFTTIATAIAVTKMEMSNKTVRVVTRANRNLIPRTTLHVNDIEFDIFEGKHVTRLCYDHTESKFFKVPLQHPSSGGVAISKAAFGEGLERFAYQFFEIFDDLVSVAGMPLVAKECRFVEDFDDQENFVKRFCSMQSKARMVAEAFNKKLNDIKRLHPKTPRVSFLDCSVYYVPSKDDEGKEKAVLVERKLEGEFMKWNTNNGKIFGDDIRVSENVRCQKEGVHDIYIIEEDIEDDYLIEVTPDDVAQAFSHFSYNHSGKKMLICDLQGVFDDNMFFFTDPVIHYYNNEKKQNSVHGRTDRGKKGIDDFLSSHKCSILCKLVQLGFKDARCSGKHK